MSVSGVQHNDWIFIYVAMAFQFSQNRWNKMFQALEDIGLLDWSCTTMVRIHIWRSVLIKLMASQFRKIKPRTKSSMVKKKEPKFEESGLHPSSALSSYVLILCLSLCLSNKQGLADCICQLWPHTISLPHVLLHGDNDSCPMLSSSLGHWACLNE